MTGQRLCSIVEQGCWLGPAPVGLCEWAPRLSRFSVRLLDGQDGKLHSAVDQNCKFPSLCGWGSTAGFGLMLGDLNQAEFPAELCWCTA